jgi:hypothetical protein
MVNMSKKKKKKPSKSIMLLNELDKSLETTRDSLVKEIEETQRRLAESDARALKKQRKKLRKEMGVIPYYVSRDRVKAREEAIKRMESTKMLDRVEMTLKQLGPIVVIVARLIATLILSIFSIEPIRRIVRPETIKRMDSIYKIAMSIG